MNDNLNSDNKILIEAEYSRPRRDLLEDIREMLGLIVVLDIIEKHPEKINEKIKILLEALIADDGLSIQIKDVRSACNNSGDPSLSCFKVMLYGTEEELKSIAGDNMFFYKWKK